jgi:hypothetical protein
MREHAQQTEFLAEALEALSVLLLNVTPTDDKQCRGTAADGAAWQGPRSAWAAARYVKICYSTWCAKSNHPTIYRPRALLTTGWAETQQAQPAIIRHASNGSNNRIMQIEASHQPKTAAIKQNPSPNASARLSTLQTR